MNLGGPELLILLAVVPALMVSVALPLWAIVDAATRPDWAWTAAGQSKVLWIILPIVGSLSCVGWILAIVYLAVIRPGVVRAEAQGQSQVPPGYGGPLPPGSF